MIRFLSIFLLTVVVIAEAEPEIWFGTGTFENGFRKEVSYSKKVAGNSIEVLVRHANYDFSGHKISGGERFEENQLPEDFKSAIIDGVEIAGTDGKNPFVGAHEGKMVRDTIRDIELKWNDEDVHIPRALRINLPGLELAGDYGGANAIQFVPNPAGDALLIQLIGGDGGGRDLVSLILRKNGKHQQIYHGYREGGLPPNAEAWELVKAEQDDQPATAQKSKPEGKEEPALDAALLSIHFDGDAHHDVELDGYGTCRQAHWVAAEVEGGLAAANRPYVSTAVPDHYNRGGAPIAYVRGSKPSFAARFRAPEGAQSDATVSGEVRASFQLGADKAVDYLARVSGEAKLVDGEWIASDLTCDLKLPGKIGYSEDFTITLSVTSAAGTVSQEAVARLPFYLLRRAPEKDLPLLHTPVDLACRAAAGLDDDADIIEAVWQPFAKLRVTRARDGQPLAYYGTYHSTAGDLRGLLVSGFGQCTTWAYLQHAALGGLGIDSEITGVFPSIGKGRILVNRWAALEGTKFITSGPNGICETTAAGDDVQAIAVGAGRPNTEAVDTLQPDFPSDSLRGDDFIRQGYLLPGPDGILQTTLDAEDFLPVVPLGFGYPQQRGYRITDPEAEIQLGGDDILSGDAKGAGWVMTGANGILETSPQDGLENASMGRVTVSEGCGSTGLNLRTYLARRSLAEWPRKVGGDDVAHDNSWISTGPNGIAETKAMEGEEQKLPLGKGTPDVPVIGPGPNGLLDTQPGGDDAILDESEALKLAGDDFPYLPKVNIWPLEGVVGQQATNPPPDFPNHVILSVGGTLYDPSYGTGPYPDHATWEKASLFGLGTSIKDADGKSVHRGKVRREGRLSGIQRMLDPD